MSTIQQQDPYPSITTTSHRQHHHQNFITRYIFSQDHKVISKQFLITGMLWAIVGGLFSVLFRLQLAYPGSTYPILSTVFGDWV